MVTLTIGSTCSEVPEAERTRTYSGTIDRASEGFSHGYVVSLGDARFLSGPICTWGVGAGCHQFFADEEMDRVTFILENNNDNAHGGHITEQIASGTWLEIIGSASGHGPVNGPSIEATGTAEVWYCPSPRGYPFPCPDYIGCSADLHLTFVQ